ncbi:MAG: DUF484 family protein [Burkholderiaceae bacterium]|nr:DUF484 family protein [Burkholderiaceae bacterium]
MSSSPLAADDVARFLKETPEFFTDHAELFSSMRVPHPHETRAISLGERQILTLRARSKEMEWQLSGLIENAMGNQKISKTLIDWCSHMLAEDNATQLPGHIVQGLSQLFGLPSVALRLWDFPTLTNPAYTADITDSIQAWAATLARPYCGPMDQHEVANWLDTPPASLAAIALRPSPESPPFGLLVLGSDDAARFTSDMGTDFLETIRDLTSASLLRLSTPQFPASA